MDAGKMDRLVTLQHRSVAATDANGSAVQSFADYAEVWAAKLDAGGREFYAGQQVQAEIVTRFRIRYRTDVLPTDRITFDGKSFNISHMQEIGRHDGLMLFATAVVSG